MTTDLAKEITRSMREEPARWEAPDHGWNVGLLCRRDDGLEVMQDYDEPAVRIQSDNFSKLHFKAVRLDPTWFNAAGALLREMKALHQKKLACRAAAALKVVRAK